MLHLSKLRALILGILIGHVSSSLTTKASSRIARLRGAARSAYHAQEGRNGITGAVGTAVSTNNRQPTARRKKRRRLAAMSKSKTVGLKCRISFKRAFAV